MAVTRHPADRRLAEFMAFLRRFERAKCGCWVWDGAVDRDGTPRFRGRGARHVAMEWSIGPLPARAYVRASCGNRKCIRPSHAHVGVQPHAPPQPEASRPGDLRDEQEAHVG